MGLARYALQVLAVAVALIAAPWLVPAAQAHNAMSGHAHVGHVHVAPSHAVAAPEAAPEASAPMAATGQAAAHELRIATSESPADPIDTGGCAVGCCGPGVSCCGAALAIAPPADTPPVLRSLLLGFAQPVTGAGVDPEALRKPPRTPV